MRFVIAGKGQAACRILRHILDLTTIGAAEMDIVALPVAADDGRDEWQPSLRGAATRLGIPVVADVRSAGLTAADILLSVEYDRIVNMADLHGARAYNVHFSELPRYRGVLNSFWPIRNAERRSGVSLHVMTEDIDAGAVIGSPRVFEIPEFFTSYDLYKFFHQHAFELLKEHLLDLIDDAATSTVQDERSATYYGRSSFDFTHRGVRGFDRPVEDVCADVRSMIFPPYQLPCFVGRSVVACDSLAIPLLGHRPGTVVVESLVHAVVSCADSYIRLEFLDHTPATAPRPESCRPC